MCDNESPDDRTAVIEDVDVIEVDTSPKEPHEMNDMPPVLLASQVFNTTTYSTLMYSIARITVFGFQSPIKTTRWATKLSLLIPTISALAMDLVIIKLNVSPVTRENNSTLYWNYKANAEFRVPALIAGLVSFCKRFFIESLLRKSPKLGTNWDIHPRTQLVLPSNAWKVSYIVDILIPICYSLFTGKRIFIVDKSLQTMNTAILDFALVNAFTHFTSASPAWVVASSIGLITAMLGASSFLRAGDRSFSDPAWEQDLRKSNMNKWQLYWHYTKRALEIEIAY